MRGEGEVRVQVSFRARVRFRVRVSVRARVKASPAMTGCAGLATRCAMYCANPNTGYVLCEP